MDIAEKRVYETQSGRTLLAVATGAGLAVVGISGDVVGEFGLAVREPTVDLAAAGDDRFLAATGEDVLLVELDDSEDVAGTERVVETGAGATEAVTVAENGTDAAAAIAAGADGVVRRAPLAALEGADATNWTEIGDLDARAADGPLLAATDGVHRVADAGAAGDASVDHVGLDDARDVAAAGPFAATAEGLFRLGPGWTVACDGAFDVVAAAAGEGTGPRVAHAASDGTLYERAGDDWATVAWPVDAAVADVAYGVGVPDGDASDADAGTVDTDAGDATDGDDTAEDDGDDTADGAADATAPGTYAVATDGTVLVASEDGWRTRSLGLPDVRACAVVR